MQGKCLCTVLDGDSDSPGLNGALFAQRSKKAVVEGGIAA